MKTLVTFLLTALTFSLMAEEHHTDLVERISFGSCHKPGKNEQIFERIAATQPQFFLWLGDNVYADTEDMGKMRKQYDKLNSIPSYQALQQQTKVYAIWDDHDYGANDAGAEYAKRRESKLEFLRAFQVPKTNPAHQREGIYQSYTHGPPNQRVQFILLDTRYFRTALEKKRRVYQPDFSNSASMLGEAQWQWLEDTLKQPAQLRIICSSLQLISEEHRYEKWANMPLERARLIHLLRKASGRVLTLSGDRHFSEFSCYTQGRGKDIWDITSSGLTCKERDLI